MLPFEAEPGEGPDPAGDEFPDEASVDEASVDETGADWTVQAVAATRGRLRRASCWRWPATRWRRRPSPRDCSGSRPWLSRSTPRTPARRGRPGSGPRGPGPGPAGGGPGGRRARGVRPHRRAGNRQEPHGGGRGGDGRGAWPDRGSGRPDRPGRETAGGSHGAPATTVHRLLGRRAGPGRRSGGRPRRAARRRRPSRRPRPARRVFSRNEEWPLDAELVVVDEASMLDAELA